MASYLADRAAGGGAISACVWDDAGQMELLRWFWDLAADMDPDAGALELHDVCCAPLEITTKFSSFDEYWRPFLGGTGPAPSYVASLETDRRTRFASELDRSPPRDREGAISFTARAWAVRGAVA